MLPARCGIDTLTTVVSSTSMNVASMTATVTIQGFTGLGELSDMGLQSLLKKNGSRAARVERRFSAASKSLIFVIPSGI